MPSAAPAAYAPPPNWVPTEQPDQLPPVEYARMVPTHRGPRVGRIVLVVVVAALLAGAAYGLHRVTARADHKLSEVADPPMVTISPDISGPMTLSGIPVRLNELPDGWTQVPPDQHDSNATPDPAGCREHDHDERAHLDEASSEFKENGYVVESGAQRVASQAVVRADLADFAAPRAERCLQLMFRRGFAGAAQGATVRAVRVRVRMGTAGGPSNVAGVITGGATIAANGRSVRLYFELVMITGDRVESTVMFMRAGVPIDPWLRDPLVAAVADRTAQL
jgi:hypothetical protein